MALVAEARADPGSVREEGLAKILAFQEYWRSGRQVAATDATSINDESAQVTARAEDAAAIEAKNAEQEEASGVDADATVASINTEPKCAELPRGVPWDTVCWRDLTQPSECLVLLLPYEFDKNNYVNTPEKEELTWAGACEGGVAAGKGVMTWTLGVIWSWRATPGNLSTGSGRIIGCRNMTCMWTIAGGS